MKRKLILGPPGAGKTSVLLDQVDQYLAAGVPPNKIAFISFTRAAVREARERAISQFGFTKEEMPYFRTVHSLCFYMLGLRRSDVFGREALSYLAEITGEELSGKTELDAPTIGDRGDALLFLDQLARTTLTPLREVWETHGGNIDWFRLKRFVDAYETLKADLGLVDFQGMLERYVAAGIPVDVEVALIDESQDLSRSQWQVLERAFSNVSTLIVAGDDDQSLFDWAGAAPDIILDWQHEREVLSKSYRLPRKIWELAGEVAGRISRRWAKIFEPTEHEGTVEWLGKPDEVDLSQGSWLLLARTRRQLASLVTIARDQGVVHSVMGQNVVNAEHVRLIQEYERDRAGNPSLPLWHDALVSISLDEREFLLSCLRRGESLTRPPRIRISTIHGCKGWEADQVLLLTDLNARIRRGMDVNPDAEHRVLYVAVTRARNALYLVTPQRHGFGYQL